MGKISFTNDIISDSLTRVRNAVLAGKNSVILPNVKIVLEILKVLSNSNLIDSYSVTEEGDVVVHLKVGDNYKFSTVTRISKPGVRRYVGLKDIRPVKGGRGVLVLSTSRGVMSGEDARKAQVGGEVLCELW